MRAPVKIVEQKGTGMFPITVHDTDQARMYPGKPEHKPTVKYKMKLKDGNVLEFKADDKEHISIGTWNTEGYHWADVYTLRGKKVVTVPSDDVEDYDVSPVVSEILRDISRFIVAARWWWCISFAVILAAVLVDVVLVD